jgi:hypothetical protein
MYIVYGTKSAVVFVIVGKNYHEYGKKCTADKGQGVLREVQHQIGRHREGCHGHQEQGQNEGFST